MLLLALFGCPAAPTATDDTAPVADAPTWYRDVRPVVDGNCARCHSEGGIAFSLVDPATAVNLAPAMAAEVSAGRMPPPAPDVTCHDYEDSARFVLDDAEKATIVAWADAGAPLGDPADAPAPATDSLRSLEPYDALLTGTVPYTPSFGGDGNDYRCFLLDLANPNPTYITGLQAVIDNPLIVHHVVLFSPSTTDDLWGEGDPHEGFSCGGLGQGNWQTLGAWGPGANPTVLPEGMGIPLQAQASLVLQMHYYESFDGADQETDQSGYGLLLTDSVEWEATNYATGPTSFSVDAGEADGSAQKSYTWREDALLLAVWPHMHLLGSSFLETLTPKGGDETCLLRMNDWDFHNQVTANFAEPVPLGSGDKLKIECHWDNSAGDQAVTFGERTQDEMCFGFNLIATPVQ